MPEFTARPEPSTSAGGLSSSAFWEIPAELRAVFEEAKAPDFRELARCFSSGGTDGSAIVVYLIEKAAEADEGIRAALDKIAAIIRHSKVEAPRPEDLPSEAVYVAEILEELLSNEVSIDELRRDEVDIAPLLRLATAWLSECGSDGDLRAYRLRKVIEELRAIDEKASVDNRRREALPR